MSKSFKKNIFIIAKIIITVSSFYLISRRINLSQLQNLTTQSYHYLFVALIIGVSLILLQAQRWQYIVKLFLINLSYSKCLCTVWAGHLINNILPTGTAGDLLRSYTLSYMDTHKREWTWLGAFISEKYTAAASALLIANLSFFTSISKQLSLMLVFFIATIFFSIILLPPITYYLLRQLKMFNQYKWLQFFVKSMKHLNNTFLNKDGIKAFIVSLLINLGMCSIFFLSARSLNVPLSFNQCLFVVPVFTILASLPISYAGWGVRELTCAALLQFFGVTAEMAVLTSVIYGLIILVSCVPGLLALYSFLPQSRIVGDRV